MDSVRRPHTKKDTVSEMRNATSYDIFERAHKALQDRVQPDTQVQNSTLRKEYQNWQKQDEEIQPYLGSYQVAPEELVYQEDTGVDELLGSEYGTVDKDSGYYDDIWKRRKCKLRNTLESVQGFFILTARVLQRGIHRLAGVSLWRFFGIGVGFFGVILVLYASLLFFSKKTIESEVQLGVTQTITATDLLGQKNFTEAKNSFSVANDTFQRAQLRTGYFPLWLARGMSSVPILHKAASPLLALDAAAHLSKAGEYAADVALPLVDGEASLKAGQEVSFLDIMQEIDQPIQNITQEIQQAEQSLRFVKAEDFPGGVGEKLSLLQAGLPHIEKTLETYATQKPLIEDFIGKNGPRRYLFLFQNNHELRPTGGFIGTYGILDFKNGVARQFFVDGIFNPDGQLKENVIPPQPIQKISAGWSLHDSNWFPDFPTSAEKAIFFYEKTGGPTVDGVFTLTPDVMQRLLGLTGAIDLPEYGVSVDSDNFIPVIQEQVEEKYDKEENKPKKILSDLASKLLEEVFSFHDPVFLYQAAGIFVDALDEKQMLLYTRNTQTESFIRSLGWSGEVSQSPQDYLMVVHTNINGYKTDGVIEDTIKHRVEVQSDGTAVATTTVIRKHTGGNTPYEWWNKVNADYMRVYVPKGSELVSATGMTKEFPPSPLDYKKLGFVEDKELAEQEASITIDKSSGTRIGEEFGKTVFGNWVYVSPQETVEVTYTYVLPFQIFSPEDVLGAYSLLWQKQPGVMKDTTSFELIMPSEWAVDWQTGSDLLGYEGSDGEYHGTLEKDAFMGAVVRKQ